MDSSTCPSRNEVLCQPPLAVAELGLPAKLDFEPSTWSLPRALAWSRDGNPRYRTGSASRRRSRAEHQLDRHLALLRATCTPWLVVRLSRTCSVHAWELVHAPIGGRSPVILAYRAKLEVLIEWCRVNHPREGWARRQSQARARRNDYATEFNLPTRSREVFYRWRRAVRAIKRMLFVLHTWWERLCPARRSPSSRALPEKTGSDGPREHFGLERGIGHSGPTALGVLLGRFRPPQAM